MEIKESPEGARGRTRSLVNWIIAGIGIYAIYAIPTFGVGLLRGRDDAKIPTYFVESRTFHEERLLSGEDPIWENLFVLGGGRLGYRLGWRSVKGDEEEDKK